MNSQRTWNRAALALAAVAMLVFTTAPAWAKGGGGHGGGGHHGGGHANHHAYHPSHHHAEHHADHHHDAHHDHHHVAHHNHHHNHHHESWHHGNWGPGFWGGAALGYGAAYAWAPWGGYDDGGNTYVDNSTTVTPASNDSSDDSSNSADDSSDDQSSPNTTASDGFPTDDWPELGVTTYAGEYGGSQGQVIVRIVPNSAAAKAGFVPGDVILSLNGQPTPSADALDQVLDTANGQFTANVWDARTGRTSTLTGTLDANSPAPSEPNATAANTPQ